MSLKASSSNTISWVVNGSHKFQIAGYGDAKGIGIGKYISSSEFEIAGYEWRIDFYPDGNNEENNLYISIFLSLRTQSNNVSAVFDLRLINEIGQPAPIGSEGAKTGVTHVFNNQDDWGYGKFILRSELESSEYLKDDMLAILCTIRVTIVKPSEKPSKVPPSDLVQHFGNLLENKETADVTLIVDGKDFHLHKVVLAARSPVFKAELFGQLRERNLQIIEIDDMTAPTFEALVHFIYTDTLPDQEVLIGDVDEWSSKSALVILHQHLFVAADRYALDRLKFICEEMLINNMTIETVATSLALAEQHSCDELKDACLQFASKPENLIRITLTDGFKHLLESCPSMVKKLRESSTSSSAVSCMLSAIHSVSPERAKK